MKLVLLITIPTIIILTFVIGLIITLSSSSDFVDTNGPENFSLVELTKEDIIKSDKNYRASMGSKQRSGGKTYVVGTKISRI